MIARHLCRSSSRLRLSLLRRHALAPWYFLVYAWRLILAGDAVHGWRYAGLGARIFVRRRCTCVVCVSHNGHASLRARKNLDKRWCEKVCAQQSARLVAVTQSCSDPQWLSCADVHLEQLGRASTNLIRPWQGPQGFKDARNKTLTAICGVRRRCECQPLRHSCFRIDGQASDHHA